MLQENVPREEMTGNSDVWPVRLLSGDRKSSTLTPQGCAVSAGGGRGECVEEERGHEGV